MLFNFEYIFLGSLKSAMLSTALAVKGFVSSDKFFNNSSVKSGSLVFNSIILIAISFENLSSRIISLIKDSKSGFSARNFVNLTIFCS